MSDEGSSKGGQDHAAAPATATGSAARGSDHGGPDAPGGAQGVKPPPGATPEEEGRREWARHARSLGPRCSQCGKTWSARACGPTHAAIAAARVSLLSSREGG